MLALMDYHAKIKYYQRQLEITQEKLRQVWLNNFEEVASEVILNVLTTNWHRSLAGELVRDYYEEFYGISTAGFGILS